MLSAREGRAGGVGGRGLAGNLGPGPLFPFGNAASLEATGVGYGEAAFLAGGGLGTAGRMKTFAFGAAGANHGGGSIGGVSSSLAPTALGGVVGATFPVLLGGVFGTAFADVAIGTSREAILAFVIRSICSENDSLGLLCPDLAPAGRYAGSLDAATIVKLQLFAIFVLL